MTYTKCFHNSENRLVTAIQVVVRSLYDSISDRLTYMRPAQKLTASQLNLPHRTKKAVKRTENKNRLAQKIRST